MRVRRKATFSRSAAIEKLTLTKPTRKRRRRQKRAPPVPAPFPTRLHPHQQLHLIAKVKALRSEAISLRSSVSSGTYGDDELLRFYRLASNAGIVLRLSNAELAERAGLGDAFFSSVVSDRRSPKLTNFLRALTAIIEVADERLFDVDRQPSANSPMSSSAKIGQRITHDKEELLTLAKSLARLAREEIEKLDAERPNDPDRILAHEKQRELMKLFAEGFTRIARALAAIETDGTAPSRIEKAAEAIKKLASGFDRWWDKNSDEAIDWAVRIPVLTAGVAALGWAGAEMTAGTAIVAALVGGEKVADVIRKRPAKASKKK